MRTTGHVDDDWGYILLYCRQCHGGGGLQMHASPAGRAWRGVTRCRRHAFKMVLVSCGMAACGMIRMHPPA